MEILLIVAADYANLTGNNKLNIMGIFSDLNPPSYPYEHPSMYLVVKMRPEFIELGDTRTLTVKFIDEDGHELVSMPRQIRIPDIRGGKRPEINGIFSFNNLEIPRPGFYQFAILLDKDHKGSVSIHANPPRQDDPPAPS